MSLKAFHIFFIGLATFMSLACGIWSLKTYGGEDARPWQLWFGVGALIISLGLVLYGRSFLKKMKGVSYL